MLGKVIKYSLNSLLTTSFLVVVLIFASNWWINRTTAPYLYADINQLPNKKFALVLGTSRKLRSGAANYYFINRMETVLDLYRQHKIEYVIVSGDNATMYYNETRDMRRYLVKHGMPIENIIEDYAGFRTLDSVLRAKLVFGVDSFIIVSQKFHNQRALFIAKAYGIDAVAINAAMPQHHIYKTLVREHLARLKAISDVYLLNVKPKFYLQRENLPQLTSQAIPTNEPVN